MQLNHERPDYAYALRAADGRSAKVNDRVLETSFILSPNELIEDWQVGDATALIPEELAPLVRGQVRAGDIVVCLGAGTISQWAYALPGQLASLDGKGPH